MIESIYKNLNNIRLLVHKIKKFLSILLVGIIVIITVVVFLNIKVTTRKGVNYKWTTIKIPLYLKILNFLDRHYNYKELAKQIVAGAKTDKEKVTKIFKWTHANIRKVPEASPVIDDHVWYIIIRGYGAMDQISYVFTTLCNYIGVDAFYRSFDTKDELSGITLSLVKLNNFWRVFDPYRGVYFKNNHGDIATIDDIRMGDWTIANIDNAELKLDYKDYFVNLPNIKNVGLNRSNIQSPLRRIIFAIRELIKVN